MDETKEKREESHEDEDDDEEQNTKRILGIFTRQQFTMLCVAVGLVLLLIIITVVSVVLTKSTDSEGSETLVRFPTDGDMLEFLVLNGQIEEKDGLYATWYHAANSKEETNKALNSEAMILEADVNVQGHNTVNQTDIPIMAHPPDVYSDNTLDEWLDAVLKSRKGIKLDFKSLQAVEPSLHLLRMKNQTGIDRPVWLNADVLPGPNVPGFWPVINGTRFFDLIQTKFPDVTISPGWKVLYVPAFPGVTYTQAMVAEMYDMVRHLPQKITFPVLAVMAKKGWPHLSWLLSQSSRFSLTLWQGSENPTVDDLLFVRDNSNPQRIYYDISEPVLSQFKAVAGRIDRPGRFYPGGKIVDYFKPANDDGLNILWEDVTDRDSLLSLLKGSPGKMLVIPVTSGSGTPTIPVVDGSQPELPLQECLKLILDSKKPWGIYLRVRARNLLAVSLRLLREAYHTDRLHRPVWINMDVTNGAFIVQGYIPAQEFLRTIDEVFPYVTVAPSWPREVLDQGYTPQLVKDMVEIFEGIPQQVSLQLLAKHLQKSEPGFKELLQRCRRFSLTVEGRTGVEGIGTLNLRSYHVENKQRVFHNMPKHTRGSSQD
ncbi:protein FAM151A [Trichomycterus rosablanca]|uniref:protein FAM151A n=1 Tax=Trichomycterus rosablanca TaxID=2290929 RepID=UPI002F35883B